MSLKKIMKWVVPAILIRLVAAGGLIAWASPPDAADEVDEASAEPAGSNPGGVAASVAVPAPIPRTPDSRNDIGARLIGTAVVAGGPSIAVLQLSTGTRYVREGDEIVSGLRLVKVERNRIDVERAGVHQEIRPGSNEATRYQVRPGSIRGEATEAELEGLREYRKQKFNDTLEWLTRHRG
jgi:hypothetical protein